MGEEQSSPDGTNQLRDLVAHHEGGLVGGLGVEVGGAHHEDAGNYDTVGESLKEASSHREGNEESIDRDELSQAKANYAERLEQEH